MKKIYIAFVDTPGFFASIIRWVIKQRYVHVVLSLDENLDFAYSIGRRNPAVPILAGFEKEEKEKILAVFPQANYQICSLDCTDEQYEKIKQRLKADERNRYSYHYAIIGLFFLVINHPFYQKNHYTCSSYLARVLGEVGVCNFEKHFSLVTPKDFYEYSKKEILFEGKLSELIKKEDEEKCHNKKVSR